MPLLQYLAVVSSCSNPLLKLHVTSCQLYYGIFCTAVLPQSPLLLQLCTFNNTSPTLDTIAKEAAASQLILPDLY